MIQSSVQTSVNSSMASAFTSMGISGQSLYTTFSSLPMSQHFSWFIDYGASNHMAPIDHQFAQINRYNGHEQITVVNGERLSILGIGSIGLNTPQSDPLTLSNVFFVPKLSANLLSVGQWVDHGYFITFSSSGCLIQK